MRPFSAVFSAILFAQLLCSLNNRFDLCIDLKGKYKPVVIFCRTNNYYGFEEYNYDALIESELYNQYNGKKDWFMKFLHRNDYRLEYANDYYIVLAPGDMTESEDYDYNWYIVGE